MTEEASFDPARVVTAAFDLAAENGWRRTSLNDIGDAAGIPPETMRRHFPCRASVLVACAKFIEGEALAAAPPFEPEDTARDRLFELLMQRLDLLQTHKQAVAGILRDLPADPLGAAASAPETLRLMAGILNQAGIAAAGPLGWLRCKGLAAIWFATLLEWSRDDSPDHARTMAALDAHLRRAEPFARFLSRFPPRSGLASAARDT